MSSKDKEHEAPVDVRAIERSRKRGILSGKEVEKMLKHLPDVKGKSVQLADVAPLFGRGSNVSDELDDMVDDDDEDDLDDDEVEEPAKA
jgi:hypothetical protein